MIVIAGLILGVLYGSWTAKRRGGKPADIAQYATVYAIFFCLIGVFLTLVLDRLLLN
jgi:prolipoprotein diacylglyceryltransferase